MSYVSGDSLNVRLRIAFGATIGDDPATWTWSDVTAWWHTPHDLTHSWGRSAGADKAETSKLAFTLKNSDGRFTAYDPRSPYWPNVQKWTPVTFDVDLGDGAGWRNRFSGYIRKWPLTWPGHSPHLALAPIEAVGILGRIGRGTQLAQSAYRRAILASAPAAYWPLEDGGEASQGASALVGHPPATISGSVAFQTMSYQTATGTATGFSGTDALPDLSGGGSIRMSVPPTATAVTAAGTWTLQASIEARGTATDEVFGVLVLMDWYTGTGSTRLWWQFWRSYTENGTTYLNVRPVGATSGTDVITVIPFTSMVTYRITATQSGSNITVTLYENDDTPVATGSYPGTLGGITSIGLNSRYATTTFRYANGHVALWGRTPDLSLEYSLPDPYGSRHLGPLRAWDHEAADVRLRRITGDENISVTVPALAGELDTTRMGRQPIATTSDLLASIEAADQGLLYESGFGLGYLPRSARYNPPPVLVLDAGRRQLGKGFEPVDDDTALRNTWTVTRAGGSSGSAVDQRSVDQQGPIPGTATVNLYSDDVLDDHAAWRLRQSTAREPRYPAIGLAVSGHRDLAAAWLACRPGSRVQVINPPPQHVPGTVDQLIVGAREVLRGRRVWSVSMNTIPARPWLIAEAGGDPRVCSDVTALTSTLPDNAVAFQAAGEHWVAGDVFDNPVDFPIDLDVGGERLRVAAIEGVDGDRQTFWIAPAERFLTGNPGFDTDLTGWAGDGATIIRSQDHAHDGAWSVLLTPTGSASAARIATTSENRYSLSISGEALAVSAWAWPTTANQVIQVSICWYDTTGALMTSEDYWYDTAPGVWQYLWITGTAPDGAHAAGARLSLLGAPAATAAAHVDQLGVQPLARGLDGWSRAWPTGTPVDVTIPAISGL